ncbi:zonular occludens toxin domain-containing protein [Pseudomonas sp. NPDC079086]|uniref:zonular occludens toxin domain-containing protein n=1 Tax=unclassified Pseudomonas TaxID=196821 RepID=UPI0037CCBC26
MFTLRTGSQGASKTLNTIKEVDTKAAKEGRTVYYHNIRDFKPDHPAIKATWIEFDNPREWFNLPENAMIVIDEAQSFFRVRPQGSAVPEFASALEVMRHKGHHLNCITQKPSLIDVHMRKLATEHLHYHRGGSGSIVKRLRFEIVSLEVEKRVDIADAETTRITIDKTYFGAYKSIADGAEHHMRFRVPKAMYVLAACVALLIAGGYYVYQSRVSTMAVAEPVDDFAAAPSGLPIQTGQAQLATPEQYLAERIPRVPDVPSSAPIYDELTKPVSYPKPSCMSSRDEEFVRRNAIRMAIGYKAGRLHGCRCNSQQGTRMDISFKSCMNYVENGAFDPARPDRIVQSDSGAGLSAARAGTATESPAVASNLAQDQQPARTTVIGITTRAEPSL